MSNSSSTGGFLLPTNVPLEDSDLVNFFQEMIVGITGIDPTLVRPRFQQVPPNQPDINTNWAAIGIGDRKTTGYIYEIHDVVNNQDVTNRNEDIDLICSFYGPFAQTNAGLLRDGLGMGQNRETLQRNGIGFIGTGKITNASMPINNQIYTRRDITVNLRRSISRLYSIYHLLSASATLEADDGNTRNIDVAGIILLTETGGEIISENNTPILGEAST